MGWRIRRRDVYRAIAVIVALLVLTPVVGIELLYRYEIGQVVGRPHVDRALTAAEEMEIAQCLHFEETRPLWPWTLLLLHLRARPEDARADAATVAARVFLFKTRQVPRPTLAWQFRFVAMEMWVSRNMTRAEAIASLGMAPSWDMRIDLLLRDHICSKRHWRDLQATWSPAVVP